MQNKLTITGGAGFIFSHVVDHFLDKGWTVQVIDNLSEGSHPELIDGWKERGVRFVEMNVADPRVVNKILLFKPDYIIHAAAYSDVDVSISDPFSVLTNNSMGNINLFEAGRQLDTLKKFLYVSTDEVYGECAVPKNESDIIFPKNPYSASKAFGSLLRIAYDNSYSRLHNKTLETRFCNVFGPRQDPRKILGRIKESLKTGEPIPVHNEGKGYREYIYVKNIPPAIEMLLERGDRTYNITNNEGFTVSQLIKKVEEITGKNIKTVPSDRPGMDLRYEMSPKRMRDLGWEPLYSFEQGIKDYLYEK